MVALFVVLMFIGFLLTDAIVQRVVRKAPYAGEPAWEVPNGFCLFDGHSWTHPDSSVGVRVGVDALVAHALGVVDTVIMPELGQMVEAGQPLFRLEREGRGLTVRTSITGHVVALNTRLRTCPDSVAKDPYGSGWICAVTPTQSDNSPGRMRHGQKATNWLEQEFYRLREFLSFQVSSGLASDATYADGGLPASGSLGELPRRGWDDFEVAFLSPSSGETRESAKR